MKKPLIAKKDLNNKICTTYTDKFNIIMMGEKCVGKTDILKELSKKKYYKFRSIYLNNELISNQFSNQENKDQNIIENIALEYISEDKYYLIKIWNYCYISDIRLINDFMNKADAFIIVYSVVDKNSFNNLDRWIKEAKNKTNSKNIKFFIIGNNCDKINERQVGIDEIRQFVEKDNYKFFEISLLNQKDLEDSFNEIFLDIINTVYSESGYSELSADDENGKKKRCCSCCKKCNIF
jgi:GTPase SAR1 family protein